MIQIERVFDATRINELVNQPDIYEWAHGTIVGPLDLTPALADRRNVCLMGEYGAVIFKFLMAGLYEAHTQVTKEARGKWTLQLGHAALRWMFTKTDAMEILTKCPQGNLAASVGARAIGATFEFTRPNSWVRDHKLIPSDIYSYKAQDWMKKAPGLEKIGQEFHDQLLQEYVKTGAKHDLHPEDDNHNRFAGAAVEMIRGGQLYKAIVLYNRWAQISGYKEISLLKTEPAIIDIQESVLMVKNGDLRVLLCRPEQ